VSLTHRYPDWNGFNLILVCYSSFS